MKGFERDKKTKELVSVVIDPGVTDKRLFVVESEFASVLRRMGRESNTLSMVLRQVWDGGKLSTMTKACPATSTGAHVTVIAHVTQEELLRELAATESVNGFGNRFLWCCSQRSKLLPDGGDLAAESFDLIRDELRAAIEYATPAVLGQVGRDSQANELWHSVYGDLTAETPGMFGSMVARGAAQVVRLSLVYAVLDRSALIRMERLQAGLEVWRYCRDSAAWLFGPRENEEDRERRELRELIRRMGGQATPRELAKRTRKYPTSEAAEAALTGLVNDGYGEWETRLNGGRPSTAFTLADSPDFPIGGSVGSGESAKKAGEYRLLPTPTPADNGNHHPDGRDEL